MFEFVLNCGEDEKIKFGKLVYVDVYAGTHGPTQPSV